MDINVLLNKKGVKQLLQRLPANFVHDLFDDFTL